MCLLHAYLFLRGLPLQLGQLPCPGSYLGAVHTLKAELLPENDLLGKTIDLDSRYVIMKVLDRFSYRDSSLARADVTFCQLGSINE